MAVTISDDKALALSYLSGTLKREMGITTLAPNWTQEVEEVLARLPTKSIERLDFLLGYITYMKREGKDIG